MHGFEMLFTFIATGFIQFKDRCQCLWTPICNKYNACCSVYKTQIFAQLKST